MPIWSGSIVIMTVAYDSFGSISQIYAIYKEDYLVAKRKPNRPLRNSLKA
jgi:hypothetical protein